MGIGSLFNVLEKICGWLPFQEKNERRRNMIAKLKKEQADIINKPHTEESSKRLRQIEEKLNELYTQAAND